jgi:5-methylcytosine-specific restriction endonuclease McrA
MNVLLLNITGAPLGVISDRRAWSLVLRGRATVVREARESPLRSANGLEWPRPSVIYLTRHAPAPRYTARWARREVLARDGYRCAYCGAPAHTVDHVYPQHLCRTEGRNPNTWENTVAACVPCQQRKGGLPLDHSGLRFRPGYAPRAPGTIAPSLSRLLHAHPDWHDYLPG